MRICSRKMILFYCKIAKDNVLYVVRGHKFSFGKLLLIITNNFLPFLWSILIVYYYYFLYWTGEMLQLITTACPRYFIIWRSYRIRSSMVVRISRVLISDNLNCVDVDFLRVRPLYPALSLAYVNLDLLLLILLQFVDV